MSNEINNYISGLEYDVAQLLAIPGEPAAKSIPCVGTLDENDYIVCRYEPKKLNSQLYDIALLNALEGVIYPGATVKVNKDLAEARPTPISLKRGLFSLRIDLPGLEEEGIIRVEEPTNSTVQSAINKSINYWFTNNKGYTIASRQQFRKTDIYSNSQTALDLDLNAKWLSGELKNHLFVKSDEVKTSVVAMYKQIFYSVTMDAPNTPSDLFHESVTLENIQPIINNSNPLGYVRSIDYGRICFVKIESSNVQLKGDIHSFLSLTQKGVTVTADVKASYDKIRKESTITVISLGGNATAASKVVTSSDVTELMNMIKNHAEFSRDNSGVALSYTTAFAKDNAVALVSSTTNYLEKTYEIFNKTNIEFKHMGGYIAQCFVSYQKRTVDSAGNIILGSQETIDSGKLTAPYNHNWFLDGDCCNFKIDVGSMDGLIWHKWRGRGSWRQIFERVGVVGPTINIHISGTSLSPSYKID